ncbi:MAG TPA: hypothetical protein PKY87_16070, partial [Terricaulis sp.]|nr:hypothetical protein [Terricaulis sp.]
MSEPIFVSVLAPFSGAPVTRIVKAGMTCAEIVEHCYSTKALQREWDDALVLYLGDRPLPREWWSKARPKPGVLVGLRPRPRWTYIGAALGYIWTNVIGGWSGLAYGALTAAASYGISALTATDPDTMSIDPRFSIDGARNAIQPYASWPAVLGTHRVFPPHAAKQWTQTNGETVWLHVLLGLGLGPVSLDGDSIQIGDTPLSNFAGSHWAVKEKPGDPIPPIWARSPDEQDGPGLVDNASGWVTRTTDSSDCDALEVELAWLEGLLRITSSGKHDAITVQYRLRYRQVGETDWRSFADGTVSASGALYSQHRATLQPFRVTHTREGVGGGQFEVGFLRVTEDYTNPNIRTRIGWAKLRSFTNAPPVIDDNLALLHVTVEAGPQVQSVVDRINCVISRVAPLWDSGEEDWTATPAATSNPAALARWVAMGPGMAKPYGADGLDQAAWGAWFEQCVGMDWRCDLDVAAGTGASPEDVLQLIARCGRATIGRRGGKLVPIPDTTQPTATQLFTPRNSWGLRARRTLKPETQAYRVQFNNAEKNYVLDEMVVYFPGFNAENITIAPELLVVPGKTRPVEINREAKRRIAEILLRGMEYTFSVDWEHFASQRGQRVALAHWEVAVGRISGKVIDLALNEAETRVLAIKLDEVAHQTIGENYAIAFRAVDAEDEEPDPSIIVGDPLAVETTPGASRWITLAAETGVPIAEAPHIGDLVTFGDAGIQTLDLVLGNLRRQGNYEAELSAAAYVDALYDDDDAPEPVWYSNISGDAFPAPPAPQIMGMVASDVGMFVDFDFPIATASRVVGIETYWRPKDDADARFEAVGVLGAGVRLATFPPGSRGSTYELLIVAVGEFSRTQTLVELQSLSAVATRFFGRLTQYAVTVPASSAGVVSSFANAGGVFEIFDGDTNITTTANIAFSVDSETGVDVSIDPDTGEFSVNSMSANTGTATLKAVIDGDEDATLYAGYSISKAIAGAAGADGADGSPGAPGADGDDGADGADGADGLSIAELVIYRRASSAPSTPTGGS